MTDLRLGDSIHILKDIPDKSVDLIVTDPPYELPSRKGGGSQGRKVASVMKECEQLGIVNGFDEEILNECMRVMRKPNIYIFCNARQIPQYIDFFVNRHKCSFDILVWIKDNPVPTYSNKYLTDKEYILYFRKGGYCQPANYEAARSWFMCPINQKDKDLYRHPTIKPLSIIERLVSNSSMGGGIVLDPFMGSGTTGVACVKLKRDFIGIEINNKYFDIAKARIENEQKQHTLF